MMCWPSLLNVIGITDVKKPRRPEAAWTFSDARFAPEAVMTMVSGAGRLFLQVIRSADETRAAPR